jgi:hypothetical protein
VQRFVVALDALHAVNETVAAFGTLEPLRRSVHRNEHVTLRVVFRAPAGVDLTEPEEHLVALEGVRRVDVRHLGLDDD